MSKFWEWLKKAASQIGEWCYKYIGGLFMESKDGKLVISIGRVSFIAVFLILAWHWLFKDAPEGGKVLLPDGLLEVFYALSGYIFGTKLVGALKSKWGNGGP